MKNSKYEFPFEKLPRLGALPLPIFQGAVNEVIKVHKVPPKLAHYCAFSLVGSLAQMHVDVQKPAGGVSPVGVYVLLQGSSGQRKTKVDECLFGGLRKPSKAQRARYLDEVEAYKVREKIWSRKNKVLMRAFEQAFADGKDTSSIESKIAENQKEKPGEPKEIKMVFKDVTMAALKSKLDESPNATLLSSDGRSILNGFLLENDADVNQLWSGEEIDVLRTTRKSFALDDPRLTFSVMIQNDALSRIMLGKGEKGKESGFFARVIFSDVGSTIGDRMIDVIETPIPDLDVFNQRVSVLLVEYIEAISGGSYKRRVLKFSAEASRVWIAYFNYVESNSKDGGRYGKANDHASKLADNVARVAAGLHVLEGFEGEIGMDCLLSAIALCDEASKDYVEHLAPKDRDEIEAIEFKDWLVDKYVSKRVAWVDLNKLLQLAPNRMRSAKTIHRYLEILERDEYLVVWPPGSGGRTKAQVEFRMTRSGEARSRVPALFGLPSIQAYNA